MSIRWRDGRPIVEIYDPVTKAKQHVRPSDHGMAPPTAGASERTWQRFAAALERAALNERDLRRPGSREETCDSFATRWPDDYRRARKGGGERARSTVEHRRDRVKAFGKAFHGRTLRSVQRAEARAWAAGNPSTVASLRAMFTDAIEDGLAETNPFAKLGIESSRGREDIIVLTKAEVATLAELARRHYGGWFGDEVAAMIVWGAYTCTRPGETFAARFSLLNGDVYDLRRQFNSKLGEETTPKHNSSGLIYVPEPACRAALDKPRRLDDDLIFRTRRLHQWRQSNWHRIWDTVRRAFTAALPATHHLAERLAVDEDDQLDFYELRHFGASHMLNELELEPWVIAEQLRHSDGGKLVIELYGHPDRRKAIDRIRRAYTGAAVTELRGTDSQARPARRGRIGG